MDGGATTGFLRLFGAAGFERDGRFEVLPVERPLQLLVHLACVGDWTERDSIATLFWSTHGPDAAHRNVRKLLHRLHHSPWGAGLATAGTRVRWVTPSDVAAFDAALAAGDAARVRELYRGELAPGFEQGAPAEFQHWLKAERARRGLRHRELVLQFVATATDAAQRLQAALLLLSLDALDEDAALAAAQAHLDLGRPAAAGALLREHAARLGSELAVEPSSRVRALLRVAATPPGADIAAGPPAGGGLARDALVGRRVELRGLLDALARDAVVTLHGPGGIGKSRLARAAVEQLAADTAWQWPPHWVALADLGGAAAFVDLLAAGLGIALGDAADPWAIVLQHLRSQRLLLVLDNAETLPDLPPLLSALRDTCGEVRLLVTSRVPLALAGERVLGIGGMPWPEDDDADDFDVASHFDAVALFDTRARAADPRFDLRRHLGGAVEVVRLVQGLPLAIELAAAWVRLLPPREIAAEIAASIDILDSPERQAGATPAARPEHASLRATLRRSWAMLAPRERDVMAALTTTRGGFTHEAARAVAGASMPLLALLVDKSLVQAGPLPGRFGLHPLVAAFAGEQAAQRPAELAAAAGRHAGWFAAWLRRTAEQLHHDAAAFNAAVAAELGNLEQAWTRAEATRDLAMLAEMAGPLSSYFENSGRYREGLAWLTRVLPPGGPAPAERRLALQVHRGAGALAYRLGAHERVEQHARAALRLAQQLGDTASLKAALNLGGLTLWQRNRFAEASRYFQAALRQAERDADGRGIAAFTANLGLVARELGDFERSLALLTRAHAMARERSNHRGVAIGCNNIGNHHRLFAAWDEALRWLHEGLATVEQQGLDGLRASFLVNIGLVELGRGALEAARAWLERALELEHRGAEPYLLVAARLGMAQLTIRCGALDEARRWLVAAVRQARAQRASFHELGAIVVLAEWRAAQGEHGLAAALLQRLLDDPALDATLRIEAGRALAALGTAAGAVGPSPKSPVDALDELIAEDLQHAARAGGTPVERSAS